jgi:hypothetical protein
MNELQHIVLFIRSGGLEAARARDIAELKAERRRMESARIGDSRIDHYAPTPEGLGMLSLVTGASRGVLQFLLR